VAAGPFRVAITGLGGIAATGHDVVALWRGWCAGTSGIAPLHGVDTTRLQVRTAAQVRGFDPAAHFDARRIGMLDRAAQLALVAAREAMAGLAPADRPPAVDPARAGVILAAGLGLETFDAAYHALYAEAARRLHPFTVPRIMPNAPASHIAMEFGLRGPSFAVASACASATHAIGLAFQMVRCGVLDLAVTGGSEAAITLGFLKAWDALRVLSPDTCRPFSRDRNGLVIGEGAAILVLEEWQRARARGAVIHAEVLGCGMSSDALDVTAPDPRGAAQAMQAALDDAGLRPDQVDYVNAHGTGTRHNDRAEAVALATVFGAHLARLPVSSTKSMIGHCLNAAGALECLASVLALREGVLPPTIGFRESDPECPVDCVPNQARHVPIEVAMSNSFAFGGLNAVLVLRRAT
jgi:nodulation protein E